VARRALGVEARSRALLSDDDAVERLYCESIERLGRTQIRADLARAHLLYGEWLRRQRRRVDARAQLRVAHEMMDSMAWMISPSGQGVSYGPPARRPVATGDEQLTAQEALIARMARDGLSNPEIAARMFISARTIQYHLRKVFAKLGIESRTHLDRVLPD
jgi:DNA-binding CsgD family transcriptional regulator